MRNKIRRAWRAFSDWVDYAVQVDSMPAPCKCRCGKARP